MKKIKEEFTHLSHSDAIWDKNNKPVSIANNAKNINAVNLSDVYISSYNQNLFSILEKIVADMLLHEKTFCFIETKEDFMNGTTLCAGKKICIN